MLCLSTSFVLRILAMLLCPRSGCNIFVAIIKFVNFVEIHGDGFEGESELKGRVRGGDGKHTIDMHRR